MSTRDKTQKLNILPKLFILICATQKLVNDHYIADIAFD